MRINEIKNNPNFNAKISLKDTGKVFNSQIKGSTKLDTMFNEKPAVNRLNNLSIYIKRNVINKYFYNQTSPIQQFGAFVCHKLLKGTRVLADKFFLAINLRNINKLNKKIENTPPESKEYIEEIAKVGNTVSKKFININDIDNPLEDIAKSNESTIFVLNHPNYHKDKFVYLIINSILNKMYIKHGHQETCPRPKIIVSQNMLKIISKKNGNIYKYLGLTEVDASLNNRNSQQNVLAMKKLLREFSENKSNIFIFPEGNNSEFQEKALSERLQSGIADFIKMATGYKDTVKVVPIGIKYTRNSNSLGNIYVGKPIEYQKDGRRAFIIKEDNVISEHSSKNPTKKILSSISTKLEEAIENAKNL